MIKVKIIFFASFKDILACSSLNMELKTDARIIDLCVILAEKGGKWHDVFSQAPNRVKVARNQQMVDMDERLSAGDEVAFFPPVTGGERKVNKNKKMVPEVAVTNPQLEIEVVISNEPLNLLGLNDKIQISQGENGASVIFTGNVRIAQEKNGLIGMTLEHFPELTESLLESILSKAVSRWDLSKALVAHRVGYLKAGQPIVFVGTCSQHRREAFEAAEFIMDYLKNQATFWKKEHYFYNGRSSECWVEAKQTDEECLRRWDQDQG